MHVSLLSILQNIADCYALIRIHTVKGLICVYAKHKSVQNYSSSTLHIDEVKEMARYLILSL